MLEETMRPANAAATAVTASSSALTPARRRRSSGADVHPGRAHPRPGPVHQPVAAIAQQDVVRPEVDVQQVLAARRLLNGLLQGDQRVEVLAGPGIGGPFAGRELRPPGPLGQALTDGAQRHPGHRVDRSRQCEHPFEIRVVPRQSRLLAVDVVDQQHHPRGFVVRRHQPRDRKIGGQRTQHLDLTAVQRRRVRIHHGGDRFHEGATAVRADEPRGDTGGEPAWLGLRLDDWGPQCGLDPVADRPGQCVVRDAHA